MDEVNATQAGTTTFQDDSMVTTNTVRSHVFLETTKLAQTDQESIRDFMAKPIRVRTAAVNTTNLAGQILTNIQPSLELAAQEMWRRKIAGYNLVRGTAVIKLVANAQPFQAGKLLLHFLPMAQHMDQVYTDMHNYSLGTRTQQPCVELDIQDGSCELRIPYVAPTGWYNMSTLLYRWGVCYLSVLSPLTTGAGGDLDFEYSIFLHFEDFELAAPVTYTESVVSGHKAKRMERKSASTTRSIPSDILSAMQQASGALSGIPVIGGFASMASTGFGGMAEVAKLFGYSKPIDATAPQNFYSNLAATSHNYDAMNTANNFTMSSAGSLAPLAGFAGSDKDEMSFEYLKKIPCFARTVSWPASATADTSLYQQNLNLDAFCQDTQQVVGTVTLNTRSAPPFVYMARFFKYWRGSVNLTIKFVKTPYHTGRVAVCFQPRANQTPVPALSHYILREIVDLKESSEITLNIPYLRAMNYLDCALSGDPDGQPTKTSLGTINIYVVNELRAPAAASQNINFLLYWSAGDDFELAGPQDIQFPVWSTEGAVEDTGRDLITKPIGSSTDMVIDYKENAATMGDPFVSLKQLLCSSRRMYMAIALGTQGHIWPFCVGLANYKTPTSVTAGVWGDYITELSSGYVFSRGGVRISNWSTANGTATAMSLQQAPATAYPVLGNGVISTALNSSFASSVANVRACAFETMRPNKDGSMDVICPHYGKTPIRLNRYTKAAGVTPASGSTIGPLPDVNNSILVWNNQAAAQQATGFYRAGADDFQLGYFIGFPPWIAERIVTP